MPKRPDLVQDKASGVSDKVCEHCAQNIGGECKAFLVPHSREERLKRLQGPALCMHSLGKLPAAVNGQPMFSKKLSIGGSNMHMHNEDIIHLTEAGEDAARNLHQHNRAENDFLDYLVHKPGYKAQLGDIANDLKLTSDDMQELKGCLMKQGLIAVQCVHEGAGEEGRVSRDEKWGMKRPGYEPGPGTGPHYTKEY